MYNNIFYVLKHVDPAVLKTLQGISNQNNSANVDVLYEMKF